MHKLIKYFVVVILGGIVALTSCNKNSPEANFGMPDSIYLSRDTVALSYHLKTNCKWDIYASPATMLRADPNYKATGVDTTVVIQVRENTSIYERKGTILLKWGDDLENQKTFIIQQDAGVEYITPVEKEFVLACDENRLYAGFKSNIHFEVVSYPSWMVYSKKIMKPLYDDCEPMTNYSTCQMTVADSTVGTTYPYFTFEPNIETTNSREGVIVVRRDVDGNLLEGSIKVTQKGVQDDYFVIVKSGEPYEVIPSGKRPEDLLIHSLTIKSTLSDFEYEWQGVNGEPIGWASLVRTSQRATVDSYTYVASFEKNQSGASRGAILRMWPKGNQNLKKEVQFLQLSN